MNGLDIALAGILLVSTLFSLTKGFVKELISLIGWASAAILALAFGAPLTEVINQYVPNETLAMVLAMAAIFFGVLILTSIIAMIVGKMMLVSGLTPLDRVLGMVFGFVRGLVFMVIVVYGLLWTQIVDTQLWRESVLVPDVLDVAFWMRDLIRELNS